MKEPDFNYKNIRIRDYTNPAEACSDLVDMMIEADAERDLELLRAEMRKPNPDAEKIVKLFCGDKYNIPINEYNRR